MNSVRAETGGRGASEYLSPGHAVVAKWECVIRQQEERKSKMKITIRKMIKSKLRVGEG
jgi:hypothetical protein